MSKKIIPNPSETQNQLPPEIKGFRLPVPPRQQLPINLVQPVGDNQSSSPAKPTVNQPKPGPPQTVPNTNTNGSDTP